MIYSVDFCIRKNGDFQTIRNENICALSISECQEVANKIRERIQKRRKHQVHYFIEA